MRVSQAWIVSACCLLMCVEAVGAVARQTPPLSVEAVTRPRYDLQMGFPIPGRVTLVLVEPGQVVKAGQELIRLDDAAARIQIELLRLRADSDLEIQAAKAEWDLAKLQVQLTTEAFSKYAATNIERERAILEAEKARLAHELFKQRQLEARAQLREAEDRVGYLSMKAPRDGVIDRVAIEVGEVAEEQKPVLRMVDVSVLRIEAAVPTARTIGMHPGQKVTIQESAGTTRAESNSPALTGTIVSLAPVADASSDTRLVRIDLRNAEEIPAGRQVIVVFDATAGGQTDRENSATQK